MIELNKWAEGYPKIKIVPEFIVSICAANRRPYWTDGFYRDCADLLMSNGETIPVEQMPDEVERRISAVSSTQRAYNRILTRLRAIEPNPLATSPAQAVRFALKDAEGIINEELGGTNATDD